MKKKLTPMLRQYFQIKNAHKDAFLFFRLGDFYELFGDDAVEASQLLNITLTARNKGTENEIAMCGVPHHASEQYINTLSSSGKKVAICEQVSDPTLPGIVKREVVKIITPGTVLSESLTRQKENNYIVSLFFEKGVYGLSLLDLSTGEFKGTEIANQRTLQELMFLIGPSEILIPKISQEYQIINLDAHSLFSLPQYEHPESYLKDHFKTESLEGFGISKMEKGIKAAAALLCYVKENQKEQLAHINKITSYNISKHMVLDESTIRNLEIFSTVRTSEYQGSVLSVVDRTITAMGGRMLRNRLAYPLTNKEAITERLQAVEDLIKHPEAISILRECLKKTGDIERLVGRIGCHSANAGTLLQLLSSTQEIPRIKESLAPLTSKRICDIATNLSEVPQLVQLIQKTLQEDPPTLVTEGGIIKQGIHAELDELRECSSSGKTWMKNYQASQREQTGIKSLKIKYNKVFGYYMEISNANKNQVPQSYIRKQTLVNAERFITPELSEYEEKVTQAEEKIKALEYKIFLNLLQEVIVCWEDLQKNARLLAELDVHLGFAELAKDERYTKPYMKEEKGIEISEGRHPVIESVLKNENKEYIPNGTILNKENQLIVLTGPNMSGKSSYLRQTALIVLLAQVGSFVPAREARIGMVDRIFTRVGASDDLAKGQSTFMVEMTEAANIINNATERSLIIFDELGRGTSTYDGVSLAWAIIEHITSHLHALTVFATHYAELIDVAKEIPNAKNYSIAVSEKDGEVIFLRKVVDGGIDKSYGIEVAKLAGMPASILHRAKQILAELEHEREEEEGHLMGDQTSFISRSAEQHHEAIGHLQKIDLEYTTPVEALILLSKLKRKLQETDI